MQEAKFYRGITGGRVRIPPSKSFAHRAILCGALSGSPCQIKGFSMSRDMEATLHFVTALGGSYSLEGETLTVFPVNHCIDEAEIDCIESGSTLRFIIPILGALGQKARLTGSGRLPGRPLGVYSDLLPSHGMNLSAGALPMTVSGKLRGGVFLLPGNISSQFITGLLFALPLLEEDSEILLTTELESADYVDITLSVLRVFGIRVEKTERGWRVPGKQSYRAVEYRVEGDWSQAAFFLTMGSLSRQPVEIAGLSMESVQGDKKVLGVYEKIGARIQWQDEVLRIEKGELKAADVDARDIPDAVPALAACLALCRGESVISGAARLRIKESDRLKAISSGLNMLGAQIRETEDGLIIQGVTGLTGGQVEGYNDHRIVMAIASVVGACSGEVSVTDPWSIRKSYPNFYEDYRSLGGAVDVIYVGD